MSSSNLVLNSIQNLNKNSFDKQINPLCNNFQRIKLNNGLDVLLINNNLFENFEAMLTIDAGSIYDPFDVPGLAHLVEHLIFKGSDKYRSNNEWFNFNNKNGVKFEGCTFLEKICFSMQIHNEEIIKALDFLLAAITKPLFREEDCLREIELIDHEWKIKNFGLENKISHLANFLTDEIFQESKFLAENFKKLKSDKIAEEVQNFHLKYFKASRMQLVIKSKLPLNMMMKIINVFNSVPTELENEYEMPVQKKMRLKNKTSISLLEQPFDIKLKEKYRGQIISLKGQEDKNSAIIFFTFPSHLEGFTSVHLNYLSESISQQLKPIIENYKLVKSIQWYQKNFKRKNIFFIDLEFHKEDVETMNIVISLIYEYFRQLKPNETFFEGVKKNAIANYKQSMNDSVMLKTYSEYLFLYSKYELGEFESSVQYDEEILKDLFKRLADIKNWTVFASTNDAYLPNSIPDNDCEFGNPVPIIIKTAVQDLVKILENYRPIPEILLNHETNAVDFSEIKPNVIHSKIENGEYTLIEETRLFRQYCEITLSFISPKILLQTKATDIFNYFFLENLNTICIRDGLDAKIQAKKGYLYDNDFIVTVKKEHLSRFFETLKDEIKTFRCKYSDISEKKRKEIEHPEPLEQIRCLDSFKNILNLIIKKKKFQSPKFNNNVLKFLDNYYLVLTAIGDISENEVLEIFQLIKSDCNRKVYNCLKTYDVYLFVDTLKSPDNFLLMAYHIVAASKIKEFALANLLKLIFSSFTNDLLKCKNSHSCSFEVDYNYVRQQAFLTFFVRTVKNTNLIKDEIKKMMKSYFKIINSLSDTDLDLFKKTACRNIDWKIKTKENLSSLALLTNMLDVYDVDLQNKIKESINSITKLDLFPLCRNFVGEPINIHGTKKTTIQN